MRITHQGYLYRERTIANGDDFNVNYIVRKTPFEISLISDSGVSFFQRKLECALLYHGSDKAVESNIGPAIAYVCSPNEDAPNTCTVSFRINVLSTQHANSLFMIKFSFGSYVILSEPIKSVSKPEQIRKKLSQCDSYANHDGASTDDKASSKKRARSEELLDALANIQSSQQQQAQLMTMLLNNACAPMKQATVSPKLTLEENLETLINAFSADVNEERPQKLGKFIDSLGQEKKDVLTKMGHFFLSLTEPHQSYDTNDDVYFAPYTPSSSEDLNVLGEVSDCEDTTSGVEMEQDVYGWFSDL